jgi:hypothetical protein
MGIALTDMTDDVRETLRRFCGVKLPFEALQTVDS